MVQVEVWKWEVIQSGNYNYGNAERHKELRHKYYKRGIRVEVKEGKEVWITYKYIKNDVEVEDIDRFMLNEIENLKVYEG